MRAGSPLEGEEMRNDHLTFGVAVAISVALIALPAIAADVETSLKLLGAYDSGFNPVSVNPSAVPVDQPYYLWIGAYAKLTNPGDADGIGAYSLDVSGVDPTLVQINPTPLATSFPTYDTNGALPGGEEAVWNAAAFDSGNDLVLVTGAIFPQGVAGTFRANLGNGSPADETEGIQLFSFYLLSKQVQGSMALSLAVHGDFLPGGLLVGDQIRDLDLLYDTLTNTEFDVTFVPEPTTWALLCFGGLAAFRRKR